MAGDGGAGRKYSRCETTPRCEMEETDVRAEEGVVEGGREGKKGRDIIALLTPP